MDILLVTSSVFDLPSARRVGAIAYDGAADLQLWPGRGPDSDLNEKYGPGLQRALDIEQKKLEGRELAIGNAVRLHPGRLHCDFLVWLSTRPAEHGTAREPAPNAEVLSGSVISALQFVAERSVERIAFPVLGGGPGEMTVAERLELIVRAAYAYDEKCFGAGQPTVVEQVLVCEPQWAVINAVRRNVAGMAKSASLSPEPPSGNDSSQGKTREKRNSEIRTKGRSVSRRRLDPNEVERMRHRLERYDRARRYIVGDWFLHPKFGVGRVEESPHTGPVLVTFEDGQQRKLVHALSQ